MLELLRMRRILSSLIALGLAGLGSVSVSACALVHSHTSECATPQTKVDCEHMAMAQGREPPITVSSASKSCCGISQAPRPEAQTWAGSFAVAMAPSVASTVIVAAQAFPNVPSLDTKWDSSPPPPQSLLCTFLI